MGTGECGWAQLDLAGVFTPDSDSCTGYIASHQSNAPKNMMPEDQATSGRPRSTSSFWLKLLCLPLHLFDFWDWISIQLQMF